ncbi:MAG TPA: molybdopterin-dependent oxidoreductase [Streptosporangiaceae bacterium]|jgi:DMSO/TMAO reductase YedYZ molybdopterin-dependent catalytic subunit
METDSRRTGLGAIIGVLTAAVAVGIAELVAGFTGENTWPVVAVGQVSINFTPAPVKNFAISAFGSHDKLVLVSGILVVLVIFAALIGVAAMRRFEYGLAGLVAFALVGIAAAATRPNAPATAVLPTLIGAAGGAGMMALLLRAAGQAPGRQAAGNRAAGNQAAGAAGQGRAAGSTGPGSTPGGRPAAGRPGVRPGAYRPGPPARYGSRPGVPADPERRRLLITGAAAVGTAALSGLAGRALAERTGVSQAQRALRLPPPARPAPPLPAGTDLRIPGLSTFITPNNSFYRVDTAIVLPEVVPASWQLRIHGMVSREITLTFDELIRRPLIEDYITLTCVSNPVAGPYVGNAKWLGASLTALLRQAGVRAGADQMLCTSADGFTSGTPLQTAMDGRDAMIAVAMNGAALPVAHGFPARMVVPGLYGYVSACKWITDIEVTTFRSSVAYWAQRGWDQQAPIKTESRIDVPGGDTQVKPGPTRIAGVAWAQHKGIEAVEVRVDRGPWQQARLAAVPGVDTWRQWVLDWTATPGGHVIEARATDKTGFTQTAAQAPPEPNGATGYPAVSVSVLNA